MTRRKLSRPRKSARTLSRKPNFRRDFNDKGLGVPQDYAEAAKWYRLAAEQGDTKAQCKLPSAMREGREGRGRVAESGAMSILLSLLSP